MSDPGKCDECLGRSPYHVPSCSKNTEVERAKAEAEYRAWYGDS